MSNTRVTRSLSRHALLRVLTLALLAALFGGPSRSAVAQDAALIPDKPYYRVGETVRIEYRLLAVEEGQRIRLVTGRRRYEDLNPLGEGVIELPELTRREGRIRLSIEHPLLEDPPSTWIWVFPDLDPWPDALSVVGGNRVRMGKKFTVVAQWPAVMGKEPRSLDVQFLRPAFIVEGGAVDREVLIDHNAVSRNGSSALFTAPRRPGTYEIRLLSTRYRTVLACLPLEVIPPNAEDVSPGRWRSTDRFPRSWQHNRTNTNLSIPTRGVDFFNATIRHAETKRVISSADGISDGRYNLTTPSFPGKYELVITNEFGDEPEVARLPFETWRSAEDEAGLRNGGQVLDFLDPGPFDVGEQVTLKIAPREDKRWRGEWVQYDDAPLNPALRIDHVFDGYYSVDPDRDSAAIVIDSLQLGQNVSFKVSEPGHYWVRIGEVGPEGRFAATNHWSLDFWCAYPEGSGTIRFDKPSYRPGDKLTATLEADWPVWVSEHGNVWIITPSGRRIDCKISKDATNQLTVDLPLEGGVFQMRWYDHGRLISAAPIRVLIELQPDCLRVVGGRDLEYEEPISVAVDLHDCPLIRSEYTNVRVALMARGRLSPTGTWRGPSLASIETRQYQVEESGTFVFDAPYPGRYEVRLYGSLQAGKGWMGKYILARIPLDVPGPDGEAPVFGGPDAPEPTDLPFNAKEYGSVIADDINMADVHCAEFRPLSFGYDGHETASPSVTEKNEPAEERVTVRFVREFEGSFFPIHDAVHSGEAIYVELIFEEEPTDTSAREVTLDTPVGSRTVSVSQVADEPMKFRSEAMVLDITRNED